MDWYFSQTDILTEEKTGLEIILLSGDWSSPKEIRPVIPSHLSAHEQVRMIRLGLEFAKEQLKVPLINLAN